MLDVVAASLDIDIVFPVGRWFRAWRDKDRGKRPSRELAAFDVLTHGRKVILAGYSDGAGLANYLTTYRSEQVIAVVSYAGRLQRGKFDTTRKCPVLDLWNGRDGRIDSAQHLGMVAAYEMHGHKVQTEKLNNRKWHWGGWDAAANLKIQRFICAALAVVDR